MQRLSASSPPARVAWIEIMFRLPSATAINAVATREGGLDRNCVSASRCGPRTQSPPARVAWIEILASMQSFYSAEEVATREGGVDRNYYLPRHAPAAHRSPPAMVAWIETFPRPCPRMTWAVATREGGVDRNNNVMLKVMSQDGRHPRGWRG